MKKVVLTRPHESLDISQVLKTIFYERSNSMMNCMQMVCLTASLEVGGGFSMKDSDENVHRIHLHFL